MITFNDDDEKWQPTYDSPFTTLPYDLMHFYFFNYWCETGEFPPIEGLHERYHKTQWLSDIQQDMCPGEPLVRLWYHQWMKEIC